jgi:hypothetical protein
MRRTVTAGALALFVALFTGCDEKAGEIPTEPSFAKNKNKVTYECPYAVDLQQQDLEQTIRETYDNDNAEKGALENVDNMARSICSDPPDPAAARYTYFEFEIEVNKQPVHKLDGGEPARQEILAKARAFVSGIPFDPGFVIPPEALEEDGGVGVIDPTIGGTVYANNLEAAFVADPGSFAGTDPVTVVLTRLADPVPGNTGTPIPGYQAFPEAYDFSASAQLIGEADFWMCVVEPLPEGVDFFDLLIGHALGDGSEVLYPPLYQEYNGQVIDCANAAFQPVAVGSAGAPGWLQLAGTILEPVVKRILDVKPLNAMYFGGTGLGGRGGSLSPFSPILVDEYYDLDFRINGAGQLFIDGTGVCASTDVGAAYCTTQSYPAGLEVWIDAVAFEGYEFDSWPGGICDITDGPLCRVVMDADKTVEASFTEITQISGYDVTLDVGANGTVSDDKGLITNCSSTNSPCPAFYPTTIFDGPSDLITFTAIPDAGYAVAWDANCYHSVGNTCGVQQADQTVYADFVPLQTLTVSVVWDGGTGAVSDGTRTCEAAESPCLWEYLQGTSITLTGSATPGSGSTDVIFFNDCAGNTGLNEATCSLTMDADKTAEVYFTKLN